MALEMVRVVKPDEESWFFSKLMHHGSITLINSSAQVISTCFLCDLMFSLAYDSSFHGRKASTKALQAKIVYVGTRRSVEHFLWVWTKQRLNTRMDCPILVAEAPVTWAELLESLEELKADNPSQNIFLVIDELMTISDADDGVNYHQIYKQLRWWCDFYDVTAVVNVQDCDLGAVRKAFYRADNQWQLKNEAKDSTLTLHCMRTKLSDHVITFPIEKSSIDGVMVLVNTDALDDSQQVIHLYGDKRPLRVIDALTALYSVYVIGGWPTQSAYARSLNIKSNSAKGVWRRLNTLGYIDVDMGEILEKGMTALRNARVIE